MNPTYGVVSWLIIGTFAGWLASRIMKMNRIMGGLGGIGAGVLGAMVGGAVTRVAFGNDVSHNGVILSTLVAFLGACLLMGLAKLVAKVV
jgi:uncharacterized membrane protein YeaQ/YmgE (transglycosylase-associated protein family)